MPQFPPGTKDDAILSLDAEQKRLLQELDDLQRTTVHLKSILDDLQVAAVKTKNASRQTRKAVKKTDCLFELNTQMTQKDREILLKRRLSLYILKKFLGIHIEQAPGNDLNIISWSDDSPIQTTCVNSPEQISDLAPVLWESLSRKSAHYEKWGKLFEKKGVDSEKIVE